MRPHPPLPAYAPLATDAYRTLEYAASLKAFLRAFKGNGELEHLAQLAKVVEAQIRQLMAGVTRQAARPPYSLLDLRLVQQNTSAGSTFLRWRTRDFSRMGVAVWALQMSRSNLSPALREGLYRIECDRIVLNLQMSVTHSLYRQATACAAKMASAEQVLRQLTHPVEDHP
ncbi:DUF3158 family protein [Pseudomonas sp. GD03721]|nr:MULTISPECIES: DUF3158 family protein [unclassified Pseudomonas]MDH1440361.1 DUF3158 family protein [Pseudomonas sp. GD03722]WGG03549.1 DUF3158 family protein [Pseudomonas sp. GD03721]WGG07717.1 DUF3158 family protein [Pseudomonas sp. GD03919]